MKTILVASSTSDNKRNFAVSFIQAFLDERNISATVNGKSIYEVTEVDPEVSAVVAIGQPGFQTDVPIIDGTAFITKFGMDACCEKIANALQD